jgi:hypothetical protein
MITLANNAYHLNPKYPKKFSNFNNPHCIMIYFAKHLNPICAIPPKMKYLINFNNKFFLKINLILKEKK